MKNKDWAESLHHPHNCYMSEQLITLSPSPYYEFYFLFFFCGVFRIILSDFNPRSIRPTLFFSSSVELCASSGKHEIQGRSFTTFFSFSVELSPLTAEHWGDSESGITSIVFASLRALHSRVLHDVTSPWKLASNGCQLSAIYCCGGNSTSFVKFAHGVKIVLLIDLLRINPLELAHSNQR